MVGWAASGPTVSGAAVSRSACWLSGIRCTDGCLVIPSSHICSDEFRRILQLEATAECVCCRVCVGGWLVSRSGEPPQCGRVSFHFHAFCEVWERQLFPFSKGWGLIGQVHVCRNAHFRERAGIVSNFWNAELTIHSVVVFLEFSSREGEQSLGRLRR